MEKVYTNNTLTGDGTMLNRLSVANITKTGQYSPADDYCDLTVSRELPEPLRVGYRTLVKIPIDHFGKLYTEEEMEGIAQLLQEQNSEWRIPTKADWDELLNSIECETDRNHNSDELDVCLGKVAGKALKSESIWNDTIQTEGVNQFFMDVLPTHSNKYTAFWTNTKNSGKRYIKEFTDDCDGVKQNLFDEERENFTDSYYPAIRLVKDYNGENYNMIENILGDYYVTTLIINPHDDVEYAKIWTIINLKYSDDLIDGFVDDNWSSEELNRKAMYAIYEWNGTDYDKAAMIDGETIVIKQKGEKALREYMVWHDNLIDTEEKLDNIKEDIQVLSAETEGIKTNIESYQNNDNINIKIDRLFGENSSVLLRDFVLNVLEGIDGEIKLTRDETGKVKFGFADNAIFGQVD